MRLADYDENVVYISESQSCKGDLRMKNNKLIFGLTAIFTSLLLLCSCADSGNRSTISDLCVFRQRSDGVPIKTVLTSTVCVDPLCIHDSECQLHDSVNMGDMEGQRR